ncbi:uncharacterized protein LOC127835701 [Dreissena polymorpha]|uniref:uncharacterized protein LOC127835701 n=1 Tax=Dreissena polymorpha TaxID=45954 RepID=UPI002264B2D1|nr:uncharacterized protein LOC127835701 [Dreissena polymorpha]
MALIKKRRARSLQLYMKLRGGRWKNCVTSDESLLYLGWSYGRRKVCYMRKGDTISDKLKFVKRDSFAKGFMAWAGVSYRGNTDIRFINKGTKVNSNFYINKVLNPLLRNDVPKLFPEGRKSMVFHQDSASSHTSKQTLQFLKKENVNFIDRDEWMPKSPDASQTDFGIWGIFKRRLQKRNVNYVIGLKKALKDEWRKLNQTIINKTLELWPKR